MRASTGVALEQMFVLRLRHPRMLRVLELILQVLRVVTLARAVPPSRWPGLLTTLSREYVAIPTQTPGRPSQSPPLTLKTGYAVTLTRTLAWKLELPTLAQAGETAQLLLGL
jgi:hypothetical protein